MGQIGINEASKIEISQIDAVIRRSRVRDFRTPDLPEVLRDGFRSASSWTSSSEASVSPEFSDS